MYVFVICGISRAGKTTLAKAVAFNTKAHYIDANNYHDNQNLILLHKAISACAEPTGTLYRTIMACLNPSVVVVACPAVRKCDRDSFRRRYPMLCFLYLRPPIDIVERLSGQLQHQFDILDRPSVEETDILTIPDGTLSQRSRWCVHVVNKLTTLEK